MRKHAFLIFLLSAGFYIFSSAQVFVMEFPPGYNKVVSAEKEKGLDGSPWLTDEWMPGTVLLKSGRIIENLKYRYNVYRNRLYFQSDHAEYAIYSPDSISQITLGDKFFIYHNADPQTPDKKRFIEMGVDGKAKLYINYFPFIIPSNYNIALGSGNPNETAAVRESYLIKVGNLLTVIDKKGKLIAAPFAGKKEQVNAFIKTEYISGKNKSDKEKLVRYYNTL